MKCLGELKGFRLQRGRQLRLMNFSRDISFREICGLNYDGMPNKIAAF